MCADACVCERVIYSGRETERQRDRETERQRDRETERQRDRETERQRDRETERKKGRETEKKTKEIRTYLERESETLRQIEGYSDR